MFSWRQWAKQLIFRSTTDWSKATLKIDKSVIVSRFYCKTVINYHFTHKSSVKHIWEVDSGQFLRVLLRLCLILRLVDSWSIRLSLFTANPTMISSIHSVWWLRSSMPLLLANVVVIILTHLLTKKLCSVATCTANFSLRNCSTSWLAQEQSWSRTWKILSLKLQVLGIRTISRNLLICKLVLVKRWNTF